ncbi:MAG TPA: monovalent cation/H+ antiporter complex subunit F [Gaiellaceae bacterium]|nr:monovalent cation/H+ antiporter complex subunit F [Gaiellaceae bacterium]
MNAFLIAATALLALLVLPGIVVVRGRPIDAVAALELCGTTITLVLLCLAEGFHRSVYFNVPLVAAFCVWLSGLIYVRFVGRFR